ncbi:diaminopimelate epimerase [Paenibacillus curdlanolyticus YK9]|uniref:Diaminopimelate epimerase n=1 Tax=Paenibacillus curdlanolyticus YK9 TaxID=717606 RepID=E0ICY0_9BACL|nr:diaminopimelate epimerase [Paenibacillus curdlanolyticus]EFM09695.1 diaminopimelate epimerase [Paenibacillus curdlanolyticus YK9]
MQFWKFEAEGNSYIVVESSNLHAVDIPAICSKRTGLSGDGLLVAEWLTDSTVHMRVFNADGTEAPMCGNGARCVAAFAYVNRPQLRDQDIVIKAQGATVTHRLAGEEGMKFNATIRFERDPLINKYGEESRYQYVVGSPHLVILTDLEAVNLTHEGPIYEATFDGGTNVMFASVVDRGVIRVLPWERGVGVVEGCATGSAAAAMAVALEMPDWPLESEVLTPQGCVRVEWNAMDKVLCMEGNVSLVAEGMYFV